VAGHVMAVSVIIASYNSSLIKYFTNEPNRRHTTTEAYTDSF